MIAYNLGDIVATNNHPFFSDVTNVFIAADATMIPPLMVVSELLYDVTVDKIDSSTIPKQLKCLYYSHKTHKFEYHWFETGQIKKIQNKTINELTESSFESYINSQVILKTWEIELGKKKTSLNYNSSSSRTDNRTITAHLNFLPPVLTIVGLRRNENLKSKTRKHNDIPNKVIAKNVFKCRWYNANLSTYSEDFIIPEVLEVLPSVNLKLMNDLQEIIKEKKYIRFENSDIKYNGGKTIGRPIQINFNHCYYELEYYDYLTNKNELIRLDKLLITSIESYYSQDFAPKFDDLNIDKDIYNFLKEHFEENSDTANFFRIVYEDVANNTLTRTITEAEYIYNDDDDEDTSSDNNDFNKKYIKANCLLRNGEERYFRYGGILKIEKLNL